MWNGAFICYRILKRGERYRGACQSRSVTNLRALLFDSRVQNKWSFEQLPLVQRIMNTVEKTSTGVTPAELNLSYSIRLSSHIMTPLSSVDSSDTSLSDRMDEWISRQHTLLVLVQENQLKSDQHQLVENDPDITDYPIWDSP